MSSIELTPNETAEAHYARRLADLIHAVSWDIELPTQWRDYFDERGELPSYSADERNNQRIRVRIYGVVWFDRCLPFRPRTADPVGVYTKDFSRTGVGFLTPMELFPEECLRMALPTFWVQLRVARVRRITSKCYEVGSVLVKRHDPGLEVFENKPEV